MHFNFSDVLFFLAVFFIAVAIFAFLMELLNVPFPVFKRRYELKTSYVNLCREVINYTSNHLVNLGIKKYPSFEIKYFKSKKMHARYDSSTKKVIVYLKNHQLGDNKLDVIELVDSILHEVRHYQQHQTNKNYFDIINYKKYGYTNAPAEIDARKYAKDNSAICIQYLFDKNIIDFMA